MGIYSKITYFLWNIQFLLTTQLPTHVGLTRLTIPISLQVDLIEFLLPGIALWVVNWIGGGNWNRLTYYLLNSKYNIFLYYVPWYINSSTVYTVVRNIPEIVLTSRLTYYMYQTFGLGQSFG